MIEGFALLAARVHLRMDDDFPEITQSLLNVVYPHYIRPLPSMTIAEFRRSAKSKMTTGKADSEDRMLYSRPVEGHAVQVPDLHDTEVWPIAVTEAQWTTLDRLDPPLKAPGAVAALRVRLNALAARAVQARWR